MRTFGENILFGCPEGIHARHIANLPADALGVKLRLRAGQSALAFVRRPQGISAHYLLTSTVGAITLGWPVAANSRRTRLNPENPVNPVNPVQKKEQA